MRNRPIRTSFELVLSDANGKLKHLKQSDDGPSECHDKAPRKTVTKSFSFRKGISRAKVYDTAVNENASKRRHYRIFKSFRKKDKSELKQNIRRRVDGSFQTPGLKSDRQNGQSAPRAKAYGKVHKIKRIPKHHKQKLETSAAKDSKRSTLQRVFSLRIKSRTDSQCEKIDISSLVKVVNFNKNTGKRLATRQATMTVKEFGKISSDKSLPPDLNKKNALKNTGLEFTVLSPTCVDLYGSDEEGLTAFSFEVKRLSTHKFNETHVLDRKNSLDTTENNGVKSVDDCSKHNNSGTSSAADDDNTHKRNNELDSHAPEVQENCETYSNLTFHLDDSEKSLNKGSSVVETIKPSTSVPASDYDTGTDKAAPDAISDLPSFKKRLDSNDCDITVENFGNPWVLKSECAAVKERTNCSGINTDDPVSYESLGFSVNTIGGESSLLSPNSARKAHGRILKRSTSVESIDSFSSSIQSVKSEECLFSSDSEEDQADVVSISSSDSFTSAKDYTDQTDLGSELAEKIKRASSLDHLDKKSPPVYDNLKQTGIFDALDTTPVAKPDVKHTYSVDDVHRIIQRPSSLSFPKGYSLDSVSKTDKTPKSEKKKVSKRRSLDSSFKTPEMKSEFKAELEKQKLKPASSDSGLSSILSPVQENADVKLRSNSNIDSDKMYYTLPNPRKTKSYPPLLPPKRKPTRIGSLSKMLSEKAESFSGLKLGTSFKLRNLEKPITSGLNKTKSLTNLMSKKGIRVVSSISSMILGKSTSDTNIDIVDSPFKPRNKKPRKTKDDENEFVYEKVKVLVPRKRPANKQELVAERRRLTLDLKLANLKQNEPNLQKDVGNDSKAVKRVKKENNAMSSDSSSSVGSVKSPTMLDEIMKSVDTRRFSMGLALDIGNVSDNELDDTNSRSSSSGLAIKKRSIVSDITTPGSVFLSGEDYFSLCPRCKKMKHRNNFDEIALEKRTHSLIDVNSCCACLALRNSCDSLPFDDRKKLRSDGKDYLNDNEIIYLTPCGKRQASRSLQELRNVTDLPFQNYVDSTYNSESVDRTGEILCSEIEHRQPNHKARRSLPYSLMKCQPCLDLSADDLDEIGSIEEESDQIEYLKTAEKSHSCSDLLDTSIETDPAMYYDKPLERKPSKRGDRPPVKVKSLSSSHDALTCLSLVDIPDINMTVDNVTKSEESRVTNLYKESGLTDTEVKTGLEESSDSGNEDYHSVGSDSENLDLSTYDKLGRKNSAEVLELTPVQLENSLDSGLTIPDSQVLLNSFQNMNMVSENSKGIRNRVSDFDKSEIALDTPSINETDFKERNSILDNFQKERKCSGCQVSTTNKSIISKEQNPISAGTKRQCFSVGDVRITCCDNGMNILTQTDKSTSVSDLNDTDEKCPHCGLIKECVSKSLSKPQQMKANTLTKVIKSDSLKQQGKDNAFESKTSKFLFDDQHVKSYKNILGKARGKSVSSDDVNMQSKIDSEMVVKSSSVLSVNKPSYIHDKLYIDPDFFPPNLSPLNGMFKLPPFQGFSAFSPPADGSQLPELEEVYKYDVCLGYLVHSITCDNKTICVYSLQRNKQLMEGVITPISGLPGAPHTRPSESSHGHKRKSQKKPKDEDMPNPAAPITVVPSEKLSHAGHVLRTVLLSRASHMIRDRKFHLRTYRRCMVGTEMVDWLLQQSSLVHSRTQAVGMWQALVEEGVIVHVCHEHQFKDKYLFYRFLEDDQGISSVPSTTSKKECEDELQEIFLMLAQIGPDAMMRMILRKLPHERTVEDLEIIYEELLHIKALSHLSTMVKRELASVLVFESHAKSGTVLFNQGDEGKSWYIILKGSVNVVIYGKGVVCTLHEGDDFGKLALVNDAPRAATIVLRDDNCHFLRVDKDDFNRILRDVEANTVRLKEHGQDVLVLEKIPTNTQSADGTVQAHYKYSIMAGTPEKMLEHLLETMLGNKGEEELGMFRDGFLEDFLLTHVIFMPCNHLCPVLLSHYHSSMSDSTEQENFEYMLTHKKCVLHFVQEWARIVGGAFKEDHTINAFLEELHSCVLEDQQSYFSLRDDIDTLENILEAQSRLSDNQLLNNSGTHPSLTRKSSKDNLIGSTRKRKVMKATDENIFKVYCADHTYCTLRLPMDSTVEQILSSARDKLCLGEDLVLCEVKSTGERVAFKENDLCVTSGLSINGRLFITPREHLDALTPLPEQEGPPQGSVNTIELVSSREMAYYMTVHDWDLFSCVQEYELIYQVFGRYKFRKITANLDLFLRRFNEIQYWVVTEMVLATNLSKRVALLRKFIKLASYCKEYQNLNSFFAIVMGLSNIAVSRLSQTWEKLPGKFKKMFADFETLMDPSRNHRVYRLSVAKMVPPIIPFMPLLMKDMTFTHEGNKTYFDGLVNFEKMHMIAQTLKTVRFCRSSNLELETPSSVKMADISNFIKHLIVIDNQRHLTQLSHKLEPRKT